MTVAESLKKWLCGFDKADFSEILTDFIDAPPDCISIFKSPNKSIVKFNDGSRQITEYYQFFFRQPTQLDKKRIENQRLLADLEEWVEQRNYSEDYPELHENLVCEEIDIANSATINSQEDDNAIYQITLSIQYLKER